MKKAIMTKTVDGYKVFADDSDSMEQGFSNLGGEKRDSHWFFWASDAGRGGEILKEALEYSDYQVTSNALI